VADRYVKGIPHKALPKGKVLVHNAVTPAMPLGTNGFRAWIQTLDNTLVLCDCDMAAGADMRGFKHYRVKSAAFLGTRKGKTEVNKRDETEFHRLRTKLKLSQEAAARLLNVTNQTAYRWDVGKTETPQIMLDLLPMLAGNLVPSWCKVAEKNDVRSSFMCEHIPGCHDCKLALTYIGMKTK